MGETIGLKSIKIMLQLANHSFKAPRASLYTLDCRGRYEQSESVIMQDSRLTYLLLVCKGVHVPKPRIGQHIFSKPNNTNYLGNNAK